MRRRKAVTPIEVRVLLRVALCLSAIADHAIAEQTRNERERMARPAGSRVPQTRYKLLPTPDRRRVIGAEISCSAWRDRWNSVMEIFMAGGNYPASGVSFPRWNIRGCRGRDCSGTVATFFQRSRSAVIV